MILDESILKMFKECEKDYKKAHSKKTYSAYPKVVTLYKSNSSKKKGSTFSELKHQCEQLGQL